MFYTTPVFSATAGGDPVGIWWRCLMLVKLEWLGYRMVKKDYDDMLSRFHLIPERYGQTDGQTDRFAISISRVSMMTRNKKLKNVYSFWQNPRTWRTDKQTDTAWRHNTPRLHDIARQQWCRLITVSSLKFIRLVRRLLCSLERLFSTNFSTHFTEFLPFDNNEAWYVYDSYLMS